MLRQERLGASQYKRIRQEMPGLGQHVLKYCQQSSRTGCELARGFALLLCLLLPWIPSWAEEESGASDVNEESTPWLDRSNRFMDITRAPMTMLESNSPFFQKRDLYFFGRIEMDAAHFSSGVLSDDSGAIIRRFRAGLVGHFRWTENWSYKLEFDLTDSENRLADAYFNWTPGNWGTIRIGNQKVAQTLSGSTSTLTVPFLERPLPVLAFTLQRRLGVGYELHRPRWGLQGTVFSRDINEQYGSEGYAIRTYYRGGSEESRIYHIGLSSLILEGDHDAQFRARPESHLTNTRLVDTGVYTDVDSASAYGAEIAVIQGSYSVVGEYYRAGWDRIDESDPVFDGWYVQGARIFGGHRHSFEKGKFYRPEINNPKGAWEAVARFSSVDLDSRGVRGGVEDNWTLGVNWYSPLHWRVMFNLIKVDADGPQGRQDPWITQARVQYYF